MRKIIVTTTVSLDGVMQKPGESIHSGFTIYKIIA